MSDRRGRMVPGRPRWLDRASALLGVGRPWRLTVWLGLWVTPPDEVQGNLARLLYIHPAVATVALYWVGHRRRRRQPALPLAAHALVLLGPARRRPRSRSGRCSPRSPS